MLKTESRDMGDIRITVTQLPAMRSLSLLARLGRVAGPAIGELQGFDPQADVSTLGPIVASLFDRLAGDDLQSMVLAIFDGCAATVEGKMMPLDRREIVDSVFSGRLTDLFGSLRFSLEVNFADFFGKAVNAGREAMAAAAKQNPSSSDSTETSKTPGPPGDSG